VLGDMDNMDTLTETIHFHRFQICRDRGAAMRKSVATGDITRPPCRTGDHSPAALRTAKGAGLLRSQPPSAIGRGCRA
jgi:hypothetical protein